MSKKVKLEGGIRGTVTTEKGVERGTKIRAGHYVDVYADAAPVYEVKEVKEGPNGTQIATVERSAE